MSLITNKIDELIESEKKTILEDLDHFNSFLCNLILLNNLGVLEGSDDMNQIVDLIGVDEIFEDEIRQYEYYRKKLISNVYLDKEKNLLYKEILKLSPQEFINEEEHQISKLGDLKIEEIRLEYYHNSVLDTLIQYTNTLEKIRFEYDLKSIDEKMKDSVSILYDSKISLYSPLLFRHELWEKIILNELMLSNSLEEVIQKKTKFKENLIELEVLLPYSLKNILLIDVNETDYWLHYWNNNRDLFIYPIHFWLGRKKHFLESLGNNKLKREFNKALIKRCNEAKKTVKRLKNQLKRNRIEVRDEKYLKPIIQGMTYLLSKENSNFSKSELHQLAEKLITNLFYSSNTEPEDNTIDTSIKITNIVLVEFILFLRHKKQYLTDKKISIPRLISDNLNYKSKGYSYQNLNKIYKAVETKKEFKFNGLTSVKALSNEMKMRNH